MLNPSLFFKFDSSINKHTSLEQIQALLEDLPIEHIKLIIKNHFKTYEIYSEVILTYLLYYFNEDEKKELVQIKDELGNTPLHWALILDMPRKIFEVLLDAYFYDADNVKDYINIKNSEGLTVLHLAAEKSQLSMINYFMRMGADLNLTDNNGRTAFEHARTQSTFLHLLEYNNDLTLENLENARDHAIRNQFSLAIRKAAKLIDKMYVALEHSQPINEGVVAPRISESNSVFNAVDLLFSMLIYAEPLDFNIHFFALQFANQNNMTNLGLLIAKKIQLMTCINTGSSLEIDNIISTVPNTLYEALFKKMLFGNLIPLNFAFYSEMLLLAQAAGLKIIALIIENKLRHSVILNANIQTPTNLPASTSTPIISPTHDAAPSISPAYTSYKKQRNEIGAERTKSPLKNEESASLMLSL